MVTWLLASLVFMTCYSGILTAMLTIPRVTINIDSLADLVAQSDLPWRLEGGAMMFNYFNVSRKQFLIVYIYVQNFDLSTMWNRCMLAV